MAKGHAKGSEFERQICKKLSLWWTDGERDDIFWRTAGSGAMAKTRKKTGGAAFGQYGDIQAIDPIGQPLIDVCTMELKKGYNRSTSHDILDASVTAKQQEFHRFIEQAKTDSKNAKSLYWMLISKRDRREAIVTIPLAFVIKLFGKTEFLSKIKPPHSSIYISNRKDRIFMYQLDAFLKALSPYDIKGILNASQTD